MKRAIALSAMFALSGCSVYYPNLYTVDTSAYQSGSNSAMVPALQEAAKLQAHYADNYKKAGELEDALQVPLLIAAGAAGLILLKGGEGAAEDAARIGIIAATFSAGKGALTAPGMSTYYIKGHSALTCAIAHGSRFATTASDDAYNNFKKAIADQALAIDILEKSFEIVPTGKASDAERTLLTTARNLARTSLAAARTGRKEALSEWTAYNAAPTAFRLEASEISALVASKGQVRTGADYSSIVDGFDIPESTTAAKLDAGTYNYAELIGKTNSLTETLLTETATLEGYNPGYKAAVTALLTCSDRLN